MRILTKEVGPESRVDRASPGSVTLVGEAFRYRDAETGAIPLKFGESVDAAPPYLADYFRKFVFRDQGFGFGNRLHFNDLPVFYFHQDAGVFGQERGREWLRPE